MEIQRVNTRRVSALDEAAQFADLIVKGNDLLNKAKEAAHRIEASSRGQSRLGSKLGEHGSKNTGRRARPDGR